MKFFSDRELDKTSVELQDCVDSNVFFGIKNIIDRCLINNNLAKAFPKMDGYNQHICGTDKDAFSKGVLSMNISFDFINGDEFDILNLSADKLKYDTFDLVEYVYPKIVDVKEKKGEWYDPLVFLETDTAQKDFLSEVNTIFERNYIAYYLDNDGLVKRKFDSVQQSMITEDVKSEETVESLVNEAKRKFNSRVFDERKVGLWKLWQAYERIKSLKNPNNKSKSIEELFKEVCSGCQEFSNELNKESGNLYQIGNQFFIRHSEMSQIKIDDPKIIDYLFFRMYSLVLLLTKNNK